MLVEDAPLDAVPFKSCLGFEQGCLLSPLLFGQYVDEFEACLMAHSGQQYTMPMMGSRVFPPLFFVDDVLLLLLMLKGLQSQINLLAEYSDGNGLTVNVAKTRLQRLCLCHRYIPVLYQLVFHTGSQRPGLTLTYHEGAVTAVDYLNTLALSSMAGKLSARRGKLVL